MTPTMGWSAGYEHEYEAALGRLLIKFNELEMLVGQLLEGATDKLGVPHLYRQDAYYAQKLDRLELAMCALPSWPKQDFARLRQINEWRNELAHGHFHQDMNTAEYLTRPVHKSGKKGKAVVITPDEIDRYTAVARQAYVELSQLLGPMWFDDLGEELK